ncbi:MAG: AbrB/MazE/SpoVT family DNA-binding domain-containing protein [Candidatus Micrarchaeia archaeon]
MIKVYKLNNKLVVGLPFEVIKALGIGEGDEVEFFKYSDKSFIFAKKSYIAALLTKVTDNKGATRQQAAQQVAKESKNVEIDEHELELLKKLDTLRYSDRTAGNVDRILDSSERSVLQELIRKGYVVPYKKPGEAQFKYSIPKVVYDKFLFGKRDKAVQQSHAEQVAQEKSNQATGEKHWEAKLINNNYLEVLESKGFIVLNNEADAANVSAALEESIKQGLIIGTRAFNKKFYIALRGFINRYAPKIIKIIEQKPASAEEIAQKVGIDADGVRSILYYLAETGDVTEVRKDIFKYA